MITRGRGSEPFVLMQECKHNDVKVMCSVIMLMII